VLALIKSLIYVREEEDMLEAHLNKINQSRSKLSADTNQNPNHKNQGLPRLACPNPCNIMWHRPDCKVLEVGGSFDKPEVI